MRTWVMCVLLTVAMAGPAPVANGITADEMCKAMHWPMPLPPTVGWSLSHWISDSVLMCFDNVTATAPDGHDVENDPVNDAYSWRVTSMSPPAGTMVPLNQQIKLTVVRDYNAPS